MTVYDAAMAIVVALGMVRGAWRGFTWQMASIASLLVGYAAAHSGSAQFATYLPGEPEVQRALAMAVVYIAVSGGIFGIAWMIRGTLRKLKLEAYDRHLGMLLGGLEGVGVGILVTLFVVSVAPATRQPIFASPTGRVVGTVMNHVGPVLPAEVRKVLAPHWDDDASAGESLANRGTKSDSGDGDQAADAGAEPAGSAALPALHEASGDQAAALPALPPLEAVPGHDSGVQPARVGGAADVLPALEGPDSHRGSQGARLNRVLDQAGQEIQQAVAETLDTDPNQKAATLHQLVNKDRQRIKDAVQNLSKAKQKAGGQVKDRFSKGQQHLEQAVTDAISQGRQQVEQTINNSIDDQLRRLGGLESAPQKEPK
jgi:membrane protein required for colicin V production